ncbi:MAG: nicotinate-nucleotide--dimethylbenzimidazole phosphoribosyltransferase [Nitrospirota bacterium]
MGLLEQTLKEIKPVNYSKAEAIQKRLDNLTKPPGSLGRLEELAKRYCLITGKERPLIRKKVIFTFAADHGVTEEGVSAYPKEVTAQMVFNFLRGGAGINVLARHVGAEIVVIDIGVDYDFSDTPGLIKKKVARGTGNIALGSAMDRDVAINAIEVGIELAQEHKDADIVGTGDMGIGNTTPSSAITAVITGKPVEKVTGRGTGINDLSFLNKVEVIKRAINKNRPDAQDPLDVLSKIGGLEIAGIAGIVIGAAANRIPVVIDGFISSVGALIAAEMKLEVKDYIIASHRSVEAGHSAILERLGQNPLLNLDMRLGEGTGAALGIGIIEAAVKILMEMATFDEAGVSHV